MLPLYRSLCVIMALGCLLGCSPKQSETSSAAEQTESGATLFQNSGCATCHSLEGEDMYGPPLNGILNKKITVYRNEEPEVITVDRAYLQRSIENPDIEKVAGYESRKMPVPTLSKKQIEALTDYLISIQ